MKSSIGRRLRRLSVILMLARWKFKIVTQRGRHVLRIIKKLFSIGFLKSFSVKNKFTYLVFLLNHTRLALRSPLWLIEYLKRENNLGNLLLNRDNQTVKILKNNIMPSKNNPHI